MAEYVHLVGVEQMQNAANIMKVAAETMQRAAHEISYALDQHKRAIIDITDRLEAIVDDLMDDEEDSDS